MQSFYIPTPSSQTFLMHFNKNHDPKNGQFSSGNGGSVSGYKKVNDAAKLSGKTSKDFSSTEKVSINEKELKKWSKKNIMG